MSGLWQWNCTSSTTLWCPRNVAVASASLPLPLVVDEMSHMQTFLSSEPLINRPSCFGLHAIP